MVALTNSAKAYRDLLDVVFALVEADRHPSLSELQKPVVSGDDHTEFATYLAHGAHHRFIQTVVACRKRHKYTYQHQPTPGACPGLHPR